MTATTILSMPRYMKPTARITILSSLQALLIAGTGGLFVGENAAALPDWNCKTYSTRSVPAVLIRDNAGEACSTSQYLENIREGLSYNVSELAAVFNVSRPTIYAWLDGKEPKHETVRDYAARLSFMVDKLEGLDPLVLKTLVRRPLEDRQSALQKLKSDVDVEAVSRRIRELAERQAKARQAQSEIAKGSRRFAAAASPGVPVVIEREE